MPPVDDERLFRVDRIAVGRADGHGLLAARASARAGRVPPGAEDPRVVLDLEPSAAWVVEQYPVEKVETGRGGYGSAWSPASGPGSSGCCCASAPRPAWWTATRGLAAAAAARLLGRTPAGSLAAMRRPPTISPP